VLQTMSGSADIGFVNMLWY